MTVIAVTNLPSHFRDGFLPASQLPNVRLSLGLHPLLAPHSEFECRLFCELLPKTSYVGEIDLDFSKEGSATRNAQLASFGFVLKHVGNSGKVLSIHSRKAERETLNLLDEHNVRAATFHWFTGDTPALQQVIDPGHYLSINPAMLSSNKGRGIIERIPRDRVLFETDGPYCRVAKTPAGPWDVAGVARGLATLWECSVETVTLQVGRNFRQMLVDRQTN
ncbi:MAG: tatD [Edaphobacter sp.]|nr:tatD [Edaphobacter sp.]